MFIKRFVLALLNKKPFWKETSSGLSQNYLQNYTLQAPMEGHFKAGGQIEKMPWTCAILNYKIVSSEAARFLI